MIEWFAIVGTIAFAVSGALVAMEEKYDLLGVMVLGWMTAFGGGAIRNLFIGAEEVLWKQQNVFVICFVSILLTFYCFKQLQPLWEKSGVWLDALGLAAFSIQGAQLAASLQQTEMAIMVSAVLTGCGGGVIRDILAGRKPLLFQNEIYGVWALLPGVVIAYSGTEQWMNFALLFAAVVCLRMVSLHYHWQLPRQQVKR